MELKRRKQKEIEDVRKEALSQPSTIHEASKNIGSHKVPTCIPILQNDSLIKVLRQGVAASNLGYRKALNFEDD